MKTIFVRFITGEHIAFKAKGVLSTTRNGMEVVLFTNEDEDVIATFFAITLSGYWFSEART